MIKKIVKNLSTSTNVSSELVRELYQKPRKEVGENQMPTFQVYKDGIYQQSDLLFLPEDTSSSSSSSSAFLVAPDSNNNSYKYISYDRRSSKIDKNIQDKIYSNLDKSFYDKDTKITYIITDIDKLQSSKITMKNYTSNLYYKYYSFDLYGKSPPLQLSKYEHTPINNFIPVLDKSFSKFKKINFNLKKPKTEGYRYALVCVDIHSRKCDAEPVKDKTSDSIIKGYKNIYKRGIVKIPKVMHVDSGTEFKGDVAKYLEKLGVKVRIAEVQRHRQQAMVERKNQIIGSIIAQLQGHKELDTNDVNTEWVSLLPSIIKEINANLPKPLVTQPSNFPYSDKTNQDLLAKGSLVRIQLDYPKRLYDEKKLGGKFRDSDAKWTKEKYPIKEVLLKPSEPPMYLTTHDPAFHTRQQLQFNTVK